MKAKKIVLAGFLLAGSLGLSAQTISLTSATPVSSGTTDGGTSLQLGAGAGNGTLATGGNNASVGFLAGQKITTGTANILLGGYAGNAITASSYNVFLGMFAGGANNATWGSNVMVGHGAGSGNVSGSGNTFLGHLAGGSSTGSGNVFLGSLCGQNETGSSKLYIDNTNTATPLIWGDFSSDLVKLNGKVGIGAVGTFPTNPLYATYKLFVTGGILTDEVRVAASASGTWADYVFADDYELKPLAEVEAFIAKNKHLPNVPSAKQVQEDGINLADMARIQQEKIEELMLYIIKQEKRIEALEASQKQK